MIEASLTIKEVAELARLGESAIRKAVKDGRLRSVKLGRALRFRAADVRKWLEEGDVCLPKSAAPARVRGTKPKADGDIVYPWDRRLRARRS